MFSTNVVAITEEFCEPSATTNSNSTRLPFGSSNAPDASYLKPSESRISRELSGENSYLGVSGLCHFLFAGLIIVSSFLARENHTLLISPSRSIARITACLNFLFENHLNL